MAGTLRSTVRTRFVCLALLALGGWQTYVAFTQDRTGMLWWSIPVMLIALLVFLVPNPRPMRRR